MHELPARWPSPGEGDGDPVAASARLTPASTMRGPDAPEFQGDCRREFFRVAARLPIRLSWLTTEEREELRAELDQPRPTPGAPTGDEVLLATLQRIEEKLDLLLEGAGKARPCSLGEADMKSAVVSASGLQTTTDEPFRPGDAVKVELLLPESPPRLVTALAQVVSGPTRRIEGRRQKVSLAFECVDDGGRDAIVRYACDVQRRAIRGRGRALA